MTLNNDMENMAHAISKCKGPLAISLQLLNGGVNILDALEALAYASYSAGILDAYKNKADPNVRRFIRHALSVREEFDKQAKKEGKILDFKNHSDRHRDNGTENVESKD